MLVLYLTLFELDKRSSLWRQLRATLVIDQHRASLEELTRAGTRTVMHTVLYLPAFQT